MAKNSFGVKMRLNRARRKNRRIPNFIVLKTKRKVSYNKFRRNWRTDKLGTRNWRREYGRK
jgi:ribosomal protein L39E